MQSSFKDLFPDLVDEALELYDLLSLVAFVIMFAGLVLSAWRGSFGDLAQMMRGVVTAAILAVIISVFPDWVDQVQIAAHSVLAEVDSDPSESHARFAQLVAGPVEGEDQDVGFWDVLWADEGGIGKAIIYSAVLLASKFSLAVMWLFFLVQQLILVMGVAVGPVFLSMFMLDATRASATKYIFTLLSICLWPFGWQVADLVTAALLKMAAGEEIYRISGGNEVISGTQTLFFMVVLSLWILVSTIAAPIAISKSLQTGAQIGSSLLTSLGFGSAQGAGYALGAAATSSYAGGSRVATLAAAAVGGAAGVVSGAAGTSGAIVPAAIGASAAMSGGSKSDPSTEADAIASRARRNS